MMRSRVVRLVALLAAGSGMLVAACGSDAGGGPQAQGGAAGQGGTGGLGGLGGTAGVAGTGGEAGTGGVVVDCSGFPVQADGALDFDVKSIVVSGNVTLSGAPLPNASSSRGKLSFRSLVTGETVSVDLQTSGPMNYAVTLPPGEYDVDFEGNAGVCAADPANADVDLSAVKLQGNVTLNGMEMPNATGDRGALRYQLIAGSVVEGNAWQAAGPVSYGVTLLAGRYVVGHAARAELCDGTHAPSVPCVGQVLIGCP